MFVQILPNASKQGTVNSVLALIKRNAELEAQINALSDVKRIQEALDEKHQEVYQLQAQLQEVSNKSHWEITSLQREKGK